MVALPGSAGSGEESMSSLHLVDPDLLPGLELLPPFTLTREALPEIRAALEETVAAQPLLDQLPVERREQVIAGGAGQPMRLLIYTPRELSAPAAALLHIHGGGYVLGSAHIGDAGNRIAAAATGAVIVAVDYRLAPETPFPGPLEDCYAALRWLHDEAGSLGVDPARVAIRGESAGGGLAAALALLARDRRGPAICHQTLIYPMIDDRTGSEGDPHPHTGEFVWTAEANRFGWTALLGREPGGDTPAHAAPARAADLSRLPPAYIATGALDLFVEENMDYARRLIRAGVPTELHIYPGAYHGFEVNVGAPVVEMSGRLALDALCRALKKRASPEIS